MAGTGRPRGRGWETRPKGRWVCQVFPGVFSNRISGCQSWILIDLGAVGVLGEAAYFTDEETKSQRGEGKCQGQPSPV